MSITPQTSPIDMAGFRIERLGEAIALDDATTLSQLQTSVNGFDVKLSGMTQTVNTLTNLLSTLNDITPGGGTLTIHGSIVADSLIFSGITDAPATLSQLNAVAATALADLAAVNAITPAGGTLAVTGIVNATGLEIAGVSAVTSTQLSAASATAQANLLSVNAITPTGGELVVTGDIGGANGIFSAKVSAVNLQIHTSTPSSAGQVWAATDTVGNGAWESLSSLTGFLVAAGTPTTGTYTKWGSSTTLSNALISEAGNNLTITGNLLFPDNTYDIGSSGAARPRNIFLAGSLTIGSGQAILKYITSTNTWTPGTVANLGITSTTFAITGAAMGDVCTVSSNLALPLGMFYKADVTATGVVTVVLYNLSGSSQTIAASNIRVNIM